MIVQFSVHQKNNMLIETIISVCVVSLNGQICLQQNQYLLKQRNVYKLVSIIYRQNYVVL